MKKEEEIKLTREAEKLHKNNKIFQAFWKSYKGFNPRKILNEINKIKQESFFYQKIMLITLFEENFKETIDSKIIKQNENMTEDLLEKLDLGAKINKCLYFLKKIKNSRQISKIKNDLRDK